MREIFSSRSDLMEEMDGLLEEIRQSGELVATEPLADPVQTPAFTKHEARPTSPRHLPSHHKHRQRQQRQQSSDLLDPLGNRKRTALS